MYGYPELVESQRLIFTQARNRSHVRARILGLVFSIAGAIVTGLFLFV